MYKKTLFQYIHFVLSAKNICTIEIEHIYNTSSILNKNHNLVTFVSTLKSRQAWRDRSPFYMHYNTGQKKAYVSTPTK